MSVKSSHAAIILSIQPEHAARIYEGSKRYELRKKIPSSPFSYVYLCENGQSGITGVFRVGRIITEKKSTLWKKVGQLGTSRKRFFTYFAEHEFGHAIEVLEPVKFSKVLTINEIRQVQSNFSTPQSSVIVNSDHALFSMLEKKRVTAYKKLRKVHLERIRDDQRELYKQLIRKHIPSHYEEIDDTFGEAILRTHDLGYDRSGFFTELKEVLTIYNGKLPIGFTTLTYKKGGSVKSGPTLLYDQHQHKGFGVAARAAIEMHARSQGMRKVYCTCPADSFDVIKYLLASGYRIEAHLELHYSSSHGELVFGKLVGPNTGSNPLPRIASKKSGILAKPDVFETNSLASSLQEMFRKTWLPIDKTFALQLVSDAKKAGDIHYDGKPKHLVCIKSGQSCIAAALMLPKRGGAVKAFLLRATSDKRSLLRLIDACETRAISLNRRKIYFLHPAGDHDVIDAFNTRDYFGEGMLRAPYVEGRDVIVMSKFL